MALECAAELRHAGLPEAIEHICTTLSIFYKRREIGYDVLEYALSGVDIPDDVGEIQIGGHSFAHWLSMGFASGAKLKPMTVPFPLLYNETGFFIEGVSGLLKWVSPFIGNTLKRWCRTSFGCEASLYRVKANHRATLREIFGSGPARSVRLEEAMAVVTCARQWLVKKGGNVKTLEQQLKVMSLDVDVDVGTLALAATCLALRVEMCIWMATSRFKLMMVALWWYSSK